MRYNIEGEEWLPLYQAAKEYNVKSEVLVRLANQGILRTRILTNPHNDKNFTAIAVNDLDEWMLEQKRTLLKSTV